MNIITNIAKYSALSLVAAGAGCCGMILTSLVMFALGFNEVGLLPFVVGGMWTGEFVNSVVHRS